MFQVKICGLTTVANAVDVARLLKQELDEQDVDARGVDAQDVDDPQRNEPPRGGNLGAAAIGLNFFPNSKRYVDAETASEIANALPQGTHRVGVFVNASMDQMQKTVEQVGLDWIQLHGDESLEQVADVVRLADVPVIRAMRWSTQSMVDLCAWEQAGVAALLVDAYSPDEYGGTGERVDWHAAAELRQRLSIPLVLAGGLRPDNVRDAIRRVSPVAVDTASGVETAPGVKSLEQVKEFAREARAAYRHRS